jgi:uncharacterized protein
MMIETIRSYVEEQCNKKENGFSKYFYEEHLAQVKKYATELCQILHGDIEIVELASYLHDISAVIDYKTLSTHNIDSAKYAEEILIDKGFDSAKIEKVKSCILNHTVPLQINTASIEEICVSNADAISQIVNPSYWLFFAFNVRSLNYLDAKNWYLNRIETNWIALIEPAKQMIENKYRIVKEAI